MAVKIPLFQMKKLFRAFLFNPIFLNRSLGHTSATHLIHSGELLQER